MYPILFFLNIIFTKCCDDYLTYNGKKVPQLLIVFISIFTITKIFFKPNPVITDRFIQYNIKTYQAQENFQPIMEKIIREQNNPYPEFN